ncbi:peptidoglycan bridge formation glycyltransferase FemA/FemB family protein [Candidatus Uhrbacteria bacterium]|nr:peptidoglycan bridge formation glycyltransferase FemA/FemB family protein [Candidatus Uhrbacteria bacterium]
MASDAPHHELLQSHGWEAFQRALGRTTFRVNGVLLIRTSLPLGTCYLSSPRTFAEVALRTAQVDQFLALVEQVRARAEQERAIAWRLEWPFAVAPTGTALTPPRILRRLREPEWTWRVDLSPSEDELLAAMHEKCRYNVRLALRKGVTVRVAHGERVDMDVFWSLLQDTAQRQQIHTHPRPYYDAMIRALQRSDASDTDVRLYIAEHEGMPIATILIAYCGETATYLHGGSAYAHRALVAPQLLHWTAMRDAKAAGIRWYDFGGIAPESDAASHDLASWAGITEFKKRFGGEVVYHPPTLDLVLRPFWYRGFALLARLRP